jgi:hemolysin III
MQNTEAITKSKRKTDAAKPAHTKNELTQLITAPDADAAKSPAPRYTKGEERLNLYSHALGALFGVAVLILGIVKSVESAKPFGVLASILYALGMIVCYTISAVYHGLGENTGKKVLRVIDHCTIYLLIMGTYIGLFLTGILPVSLPATIAILSIQLGLGTLAIVLTAVNMKRFVVLSMICYIVMGWCVIAIPHIVITALTLNGFLWILFGGIAYTLGSVLYVIGKKKRYVHGVFHLFCLLGSVLQFVGFIVYCF